MRSRGRDKGRGGVKDERRHLRRNNFAEYECVAKKNNKQTNKQKTPPKLLSLLAADFALIKTPLFV